MPVQVCKSPAVLVGKYALFLAGASGESQRPEGSAPRSEGAVQALQLEQLHWTLLARLPPSPGGPLYHPAVWLSQRADVFELHVHRSAEFRLPGRKVRQSTYLVARVDTAMSLPLPRDERALHHKEMVRRSHPFAWPSRAVTEAAFLECVARHQPAMLVITQRNASYNTYSSPAKPNLRPVS
jgi:hypothetical protein